MSKAIPLLKILFLMIALIFQSYNTLAQIHLEILEKSKTKNFKEIVKQTEEYYKNKDKGKGSGYKQFKRWEYFNRGRLDENGNIINVSQYEFEELKRYQQTQSNTEITTLFSGNWTPIGPIKNSLENSIGRINCIAVDPANAHIIYAGAPSGGLWKSTDDGNSWVCLTDNISNGVGISSLIIDPFSPTSNRTIYILTGDKNAGHIGHIGIFKSINSGISWEKLPDVPSIATRFTKLIMHPVNNQIFFVTTSDGVYKSSDGGNSWQKKISGNFRDIEFKPGMNNILYASGDVGFYRSQDTGENWNVINSIPHNGLRVEMAVTPANPSYVYVIYFDFKKLQVYRSTDSGLNFSIRPTNYDLLSVGGDQFLYDLTIAALPENAEEIYIGGVTSVKSTNGGLTWENIYLGHVDFHSMEFFNGYLYCGNDGGITRIKPSGNLEDLSQGLSITQIYHLGIFPSNSERIILGSQDNGTSTLNNSHADAIFGGDGMGCFTYSSSPSSPTYLYFSTQNGNLFTSEDGIPGPARNINPPNTHGTGAWETPFLQSPYQPSTVYAGFVDLWKNPLRGERGSWENISNGQIDQSQINMVAIAPSDPNIIYLFKWYFSILYKSVDGGKSWKKVPSPENSDNLFIVIHPTNPNIIWATAGNSGASQHIAKSIDGGETWINVSGTLPRVSINCAVYQKGSANGIYLGTDLGVFYKDDSLSDWIRFGTGMPYLIVTDLEINYATSKIYAGTFGRGAWVSNLYGNSPIVSITSPANNASFTAPANITINANASDADGSITKVEFYQGTTKLGEDLTSPYSFSWTNVSAGNYSLTAKAYDNGGSVTTSSVINISVSSGCSASGTILREFWANVSGSTVSNIPTNQPPTSTSQLTIFEGPTNVAHNYGSRISGYICPPSTGNYTFWIASNDASELWLSTNDNPANKVKIAFITGFTNPRQWDKYSSQKSALINLVAGQKYYIEALQKQNGGTDNVAVGWQLPNSTFERPIPGNRLSPFGGSTNNPPVVSITSPTNGQTFTAPANITINANASDSDGSISKVEFYQGSIKLGEDLTSPYSFSWNNVAAGGYALTAVAYDNANAFTTSGTINITVSGGGGSCTASGTILREYWANTSGFNISGIPLSSPPTSTSQLTIFEGPSNVAANYGSRIRGYICVPASGNYTFWIASNDNSELWLSSDENPSNKTKVAFVTGFTSPRQWEKYTSQKSALINLVAGKRYYIETLHIQNGGTDNIAVGWQLPNGTQERPIPGNRLSPFSGSGNNPPTVSITSPVNGQTFTEPANITINANASDTDGSISKVEFYQGTTKLGEDLTSPYSFVWNNVASGSYALTAKAFDNGGAETTSSVINISVSGGVTCSSSGTILREHWANVVGLEVSKIPVNTTPTSTSQLTIFEGPVNIGDNYGSRIRGYICAPVSGSYIFWISGDDNCELWLSVNDNPSNKVKIAFHTAWTSYREWTKYSTQQSSAINLIAGQKYYIEALHKEGSSEDHVSVGWQMPNGTQERPIPGNRLSPFQSSGNNPPTVSITSPANGQTFTAPANITINANANDSDGSISKVEFYQGSTKLGEDNTSPYSFSWNNVGEGNYFLTAIAYDNANASTTSGTVNITVSGGSGCTSSGTIFREFWNGVSGNSVSNIPTHLPPTSTSQVAIFEGPTNAGTNYGARYRGYICAPTTGNYTFWIASNDDSELWLSTSDNPASKVKIASVTGYTASREWTKYSSQKSALITLTAGQRYYIEALHKQGAGTDNVAIGWQLPNNTLERPIPGSRLSPVETPSSFSEPVRLMSTSELENEIPIDVKVYPNPTQKGMVTLSIEGYESTKHKVYINILNMSGNTVYSDKASCEITCRRTIINIDERFTPGMYIVNVTIDNKIYSERLIVE